MVQLFFDRVFGHLLLRKAYHFVGGAALLAALVMLEPAWFVGLILGYVIAFKLFAHRLSFAALGLLLVYLVGNSKLTTLAAGLVLFVGDGMAAVVGTRYGNRRWRWNCSKTIWGSFALLVSGFVAVLGMMGFVMPISFSTLLLVFLTALSGCVAELLPFTFIRDRKPDDNLLILVVSALVFYAGCVAIGINP